MASARATISSSSTAGVTESPPWSSTSTQPPSHPKDTGAYYFLVPLTMIIIMLLAAAVVFMILRKRRLDELRHTLMPLYSFDPADEGEADWEAELLDSALVHPSATVSRKGYRSVDSPDASLAAGAGPKRV